MDITKSKYSAPLQRLLKKPFFTIKDAQKLGIPKHFLSYLANKGDLERIGRGIYRSSKYEGIVDFESENLALRAASIPEGVICLISALFIYDLTDQIPREVWIAIPHSCRAPKQPHTRIVRMRNMKLGKTRIKMGENQSK